MFSIFTAYLKTMKSLYRILLTVLMPFWAFSQTLVNISYSSNPSTFEETQSVTFTFTVNEASFGVSSSRALYVWAWSIDSNGINADASTNGTWAASNQANKLTYVSSSGTTGTYTFTMNTVKSFYGNRTNPLARIGLLVKTETGTVKSQDIIIPVGKFQLSLTSPSAGSTSFVNSGSNLSVSATASEQAIFKLKANGIQVNASSTPSTTYSYSYTVTQDAAMELEAESSSDGSIQKKSFSVVLTPTVQTSAIPSWIKQGINYDASNPNKIGLALYAPQKSYVHVIGSFNNWTVSNNYLMKRDTTNPDLYWIEITGLTPQQIYTFQYRTNDGIKIADPYSRLILSPDDDPSISSADYPNLPTYPSGQQFDVSVIQTGMSGYNWQVNNFVKPAKENLIIYELLVRDFTTEQNYQSLIDKIPYFKTLGINAIQLMPIMEFEGNNSWGYNTSFHFAIDKAYGTSNKFKEFVDLCHQNGIAVILDIALNHATQRNPLVRLWNNDPDGDGYGAPSSTNPFFNTSAKHSYSVFEDFNHSSTATRYYVERVLEQWISEYKIDGFRWDLTKGFTQNCTTNNDSCTNSYQQDRVDVLKLYADKQWSFDNTSYVIFEHLGTDAEEKEWTNYRLNEGKGIMVWDNLNGAYSQNTMGYATNSNFNRVDYENRSGFLERRNIAYAESHDEERLMYKNLQFGNTNGSYNVKALSTGLERQKAAGAVLLPVPGPKMIWQFGELGYDFSINRCPNGTVSDNCRVDPKPSAFDSTLNYLNNSQRKSIYDTWAKIIAIRKNNEVFNTKTFDVSSGDLSPRIYIWNDTLPAGTLKQVIIIANFNTSSQNINPSFPSTGTWYNLLDNSTVNVTNVSTPILLQPGEFRIFGNQLAMTGENYSFSTRQASCNQNDGEITITVTQSANYVARISGPNYNQNVNFSSTTTISNLSAGNYTICVSTQGNNDEKCYPLIIAKETVNAPSGLANQSFMPTGFTVADLVANGSNLKWYSAASGGTLFSGSEPLENGKIYYASQNNGSCESTERLAVTVTFIYNNFRVETKSETCSGRNNGEINITAIQSFPYVARINSTNYTFANNKLSVTGLAPGSYSVCISIPGKTFEQCFTVNIVKGGSLTGRISTSSNAVVVNINEGTAPYTVFINGLSKYQTSDSNFQVVANQGDLIEVKTAVVCEGVLSKLITESILATPYPNPVQREFFINLSNPPIEVEAELYSIDGKKVFRKKFSTEGGRIKVDVSSYKDGLYILKVLLNIPQEFKIIKKSN